MHYYSPTLYNADMLATIITIRDYTFKALHLAIREVRWHLIFPVFSHLPLENVGTAFVNSCASSIVFGCLEQTHFFFENLNTALRGKYARRLTCFEFVNSGADLLEEMAPPQIINHIFDRKPVGRKSTIQFYLHTWGLPSPPAPHGY